MHEITLDFLKSKNACEDGIKWFNNQPHTNTKEVLSRLISENKYNWANWLIVRVMDKESCIKYAIYAANSVLTLYTAQYPQDHRPHKAIIAAQEYLDNPSQTTAYAARAAANNLYKFIIEYGITLL